MQVINPTYPTPGPKQKLSLSPYSPSEYRYFNTCCSPLQDLVLLLFKITNLWCSHSVCATSRLASLMLTSYIIFILTLKKYYCRKEQTFSVGTTWTKSILSLYLEIFEHLLTYTCICSGQKGGSEGREQTNIMYAMCRAFGGVFLAGCIAKFFETTIVFVSPQILR